ncbi:hypothetical protein D3C72_1470550 [compost metagenome]
MYGALDAEVVHDRRHVIGVMIHVVTIPDLAGSSMATTIVGDNAKTLGQEEKHLRIPVVRTERPAVVEVDHLGATRPPVLVEDLDSILRCDISHVRFSCVMWRPEFGDVFIGNTAGFARLRLQ